MVERRLITRNEVQECYRKGAEVALELLHGLLREFYAKEASPGESQGVLKCIEIVETCRKAPAMQPRKRRRP